MRRTYLGCLVGAVLLASCGDRNSEPKPQAAPAQQQPQAAATPQPPVAAGEPKVATADAPVTPSDKAISPAGSADRLPPPVVPPVERDGVRYAQAEDGRSVGLDQVGGVLVASAAGKQLWTLAVYGNRVDPKQEADAQWIFFKSMAFDPDGRLRIVNEAGKTYLVDVQKRVATPGP